MAPERRASPRMTPAAPVSRRRRRPSRSRTPPATRISASYDRTSERTRSRSGDAPPWDRTRRRTPAPTSSPTRASTVGGVGAAPREGGQSLRPRIQADGQPVAGDRRGTRAGRRVGRRWRSSARPGWRRRRTRAGSPRPSRRHRRAGAGPRLRDAIAPTASRLAGAPETAPSKSTRWMSRAPWATNRSTIRSGRSVGAPIPVAAPGQ